MLAEERLLRITDLLNQRDSGIVSVPELSDWFGVSSMTVRRDLDRLEGMDVLRRVHGGAVAYHTVEDWKPFVARHGEFNRQNRRSDGPPLNSSTTERSSCWTVALPPRLCGASSGL